MNLEKLIWGKMNDQIDRRKRVLQILLLGFFYFSLVLLGVVGINTIVSPSSTALLPLPTALGFFTFFCILLLLFRNGLYRFVSFFFICLILIAAFYTVLYWGIEVPQALLMFALAIVMSGILISTRFAFIIMLLVIFILVSYGNAQISHLVTPNIEWKVLPVSYTDMVTYSVTLGIIGLVSWLFNKEMEMALYELQQSEQKLKRERDLLEIRVKERTQELEKSQIMRLQEVNRFASMGRLSSGLIHDLVSPLTSILFRLQTVEKNETENIKEALLPLIQDVIRDTEVMGELIAAARKQYQTQQSSVLFHADYEIVQVIRMLSYRVRKAQAKIEFLPEHDGIGLYGDPIKFHQIVTNLLTNAIDALISRTLKQKQITVSLHDDDKKIYLQITDTGIGIDKKSMKKIFEPLFTTKSLEQGSGMGLYLVKQMVENDFHGTVTVTSEVGKGTTFVIEIPKGKS